MKTAYSQRGNFGIENTVFNWNFVCFLLSSCNCWIYRSLPSSKLHLSICCGQFYYSFMSFTSLLISGLGSVTLRSALLQLESVLLSNSYMQQFNCLYGGFSCSICTLRSVGIKKNWFSLCLGAVQMHLTFRLIGCLPLTPHAVGPTWRWEGGWKDLDWPTSV